MKFCKDCKWLEVSKYWPNDPELAIQDSRCVRPLLDKFDLVTGKQLVTREHAIMERFTTTNNSCGPDAKFFEPRTEPLFTVEVSTPTTFERILAWLKGI